MYRVLPTARPPPAYCLLAHCLRQKNCAGTSSQDWTSAQLDIQSWRLLSTKSPGASFVSEARACSSRRAVRGCNRWRGACCPPPTRRPPTACLRPRGTGEGWAAESHIQAANDCPSPHWQCTHARILQQEPLTSCPPMTRAVPTQLHCASPWPRWAKGWGSCVQRPRLVAGHGHASGGAPLHG